MRNWSVPLGFLILLLLSSCATQQDLADLQRQLQTTRGEVAAVRKGMMETRAALEEQIRSGNDEQRKSLSRVSGQMGAILSTIEAQQKAIAALNSSLQERLSGMNERGEERLRKLEERISEREKGYLGSQANLGARLEELAAEVKIVQGKLEENNNLLAEQEVRFDELNQRTARSGGRVETTEANLRGMKEAQASQGEKLNRVEGQVASLVKNWESWREQANRSLAQMGELEKRLRSVEQELGRMKEAYRQPSMTPPAPVSKEARAASAEEPRLPAEPKEAPGSKGAVAAASGPGGIDIYNRALADYNQKNYDLAISGFRDYLADYPKGIRSAQSQYWLGECYYSQKKFKEAIDEFDAVLRNYPDSDKARDALLKKAFCYRELKNAAMEEAILNEVLKKYPDSDAAQKAESRLKELK